MIKITEASLNYETQVYMINFQLQEAWCRCHGNLEIKKEHFEGLSEVEQIDAIKSELIRAVTGETIEVIGNAIDLLSQVEAVEAQLSAQATQIDTQAAQIGTQATQIESQNTKIEAATTKAEELRRTLQSVVLAVNLSDEAMAELVTLYDEWTAGVDLVAGDIVRHGGKLYRVIQNHTTQADWTPDVAVSLFVTTTPPTTEDGQDIIPEWVQPTGGHDAYNVGDKVTFEGQVYKSLIDASTWSPTAYPQGWEEVV